MIQNDRKSITLNDGTFIYSAQQLRDYLTSLGFDPENNFEEICYTINPNIYYYENGVSQGDDWELIADGYCQGYHNLCESIEAQCEKFLSGRKITKAQFVDWLKKELEHGLDY